MRIFTDKTGLQHIGKDAMGMTLCRRRTDGLIPGVYIDVHRVRPLETQGITPRFCTGCHSAFGRLLTIGVRALFFQDDKVWVRHPGMIVPDEIVNYRGSGGSPNIEAVVYNHKTGAQFMVPYSWLHFAGLEK